jgi:hypothetical protein
LRSHRVQVGLRVYFGAKGGFMASPVDRGSSYVSSAAAAAAVRAVPSMRESPIMPVAPAAADSMGGSMLLWKPHHRPGHEAGEVLEDIREDRRESESGVSLLGKQKESAPAAPTEGMSLGFGIGVDINAGRQQNGNNV